MKNMPIANDALDVWLYRELVKRVEEDQLARGSAPLHGVSFVTPLFVEKQISEKDVEALCFTLNSRHIHFFELWAEPGHTYLVGLARKNEMINFIEHVRNTFRANTKDVLDDGHPVGLYPPWLRAGLRFKILNIREEDPLLDLGTFQGKTNDPLVSVITSLEAITSMKPPVYAWISFGWLEFEWRQWAQPYGRAFERTSRKPIDTGEGPAFLPNEETDKATSVVREAATEAERRVTSPGAAAVFRIGLFSESDDNLESAANMLRGAVKNFGASGTNNIVCDDPPFEVTYGQYTNHRDALLLLARRQVPSNSDLGKMLDRHMHENVSRGRANLRSRPFPYLLVTASELAIFVHLPVWAAGRLVNIPVQRAPTMLIRRPVTRESVYPPILIGDAVEMDYRNVSVTVEELNIHSYFLGRSGAGKSTLIALIFLQLAELIVSGKVRGAIWIVDPMGAIADIFLTRASEKVLEAVNFFDPKWHPWAMNALSLPSHYDPEARDALISARVDAVTRMIREVAKLETGQSQWGHRLQTIIRQTLLHLYNRNHADRDSPTFEDILKVVDALGNAENLAAVAEEMSLPQDVLSSFADYEKEAKSAVRNKLMRFIEPIVLPFTCSKQNNLDFVELDKPGHVNIFSMRSFMSSPIAVAALMGNIVIGTYTAELINKENIRPEEKWMTYVIMDEFQRTSDLASFTDILATARNIGLSLSLAHQGTEQLEDRELAQAVFNNPHIKCIFGVGGDIAKQVKDQIDIALGQDIAIRLQNLEDHHCYVSRTGSSADATPPPLLIRTFSPSQAQRSLDQVREFFSHKMERFKPVPATQEQPAEPNWALEQIPARAALSFLESAVRPGTYVLPRPRDYPLFWAVRDFILQHEHPPTFDEMCDYVRGQIWGRGEYSNRSFVHDALERLKGDGFVKEASIGHDGRRCWVLSEGKKNRLVLFFDPLTLGRAANLGSDAHLAMVYNFLADYVRQYLPAYLPIMPDSGMDLPDGLLFPRQSNDRWALRNPAAVEARGVPNAHPQRSVDQAKKRFQEGYVKVIILCPTDDDQKTMYDYSNKDDDLALKLKTGVLALFTASSKK